MESPRLEKLSPADSRRLLPGASVGRLAVPTPHFPTVDLVSFAVVEGEIVVAARAGSAGDALAQGSPIAFQADHLDADLRRGWSVLVTGDVEDLDADVAELVRPLLGPWPAAPADRLFLVRARRMAGQQIFGPAAATSPAPAPTTGADRALTATVHREVGSDEALGLLHRNPPAVGRLVICPGGEPLIFPLNFAVDGDTVVFRTQVGTKLSGITRSMATFEVDRIDAAGRGWSVVIEGLAQEVLDSDPVELRARLDALDLEAWPGGDRPHVVRITPFAVRGSAWVPAAVPAAGTAR